VASLGEILESKETFREIDNPVILRRYERARSGDTDILLFVTDQLQKIFSSEASRLKELRNIGMRWCNRSNFLKRQLIKKALS
jgi:2-polyprenyl-6-methoxyphenol hydroxylase-like FAD-dependent oxidoreductase